jgi:hypothetical protein
MVCPWWQAYRAIFPYLACTIDRIVAEGEWVAMRLTLRGPLGEIPATGRAVAFNEMVFWQVRDGQLRAIWSVGDALGLRVQLGALPASAWHRPVSVDVAAVDATPAREDGPPGTPPDGW